MKRYYLKDQRDGMYLADGFPHRRYILSREKARAFASAEEARRWRDLEWPHDHLSRQFCRVVSVKDKAYQARLQERAVICEWLRKQGHTLLPDALERGEHLPNPTPFRDA